MLAATHAVGASVHAVGQRIEDSIAAAAQVLSLAAANTASLEALNKAAKESERHELVAKLRAGRMTAGRWSMQRPRNAALRAC